MKLSINFYGLINRIMINIQFVINFFLDLILMYTCYIWLFLLKLLRFSLLYGRLSSRSSAAGIEVIRIGGRLGEVVLHFQTLPPGNFPNFLPIPTRLANTSDFASESSGRLFFESGQTSAYIYIRIVNDEEPEPNESFLVQLLNATLQGTAGKKSLALIVFGNDEIK